MMIPTPKAGMVISYSYLWAREARTGQEEGVKDRPCAIILATEIGEKGMRVQILPVTHSPPSSSESAVEIPVAIKRHLKLDDQRSWVLVDEYNQFFWPGYDLRPAGNSQGPVYGYLPQRFFQHLIERFRAQSRPAKIDRT